MKYVKYFTFIVFLIVVYQTGLPENNSLLYWGLISFFIYEIIHFIFVDFVKISDKSDNIWRLFSLFFIVTLLVLSIYLKEIFLIFFTSIFGLALIIRIYLGFKKTKPKHHQNIQASHIWYRKRKNTVYSFHCLPQSLLLICSTIIHFKICRR